MAAFFRRSAHRRAAAESAAAIVPVDPPYRETAEAASVGSPYDPATAVAPVDPAHEAGAVAPVDPPYQAAVTEEPVSPPSAGLQVAPSTESDVTGGGITDPASDELGDGSPTDVSSFSAVDESPELFRSVEGVPADGTKPDVPHDWFRPTTAEPAQSPVGESAETLIERERVADPVAAGQSDDTGVSIHRVAVPPAPASFDLSAGNDGTHPADLAGSPDLAQADAGVAEAGSPVGGAQVGGHDTDLPASAFSEQGPEQEELPGDGQSVPVIAPEPNPLVVAQTAFTGWAPLPKPRHSRIAAVANQKGGVGKTTSTVNVAAALAVRGSSVLVIDLDPQGNASTALGVDHSVDVASVYDVLIGGKSIVDVIQPSPHLPGLTVVPATIDLAGAEIELVAMVARESRLDRAVTAYLREQEALGRPAPDYIFIDCPPSLGLLTVNALVAAREVFIPIQCEYYALEGLGQLLRNVELIKSHLNPDLAVSAILLTMFDARTRLASQVADEVREHFGASVLPTSIPRSVRISEAPSHGQTVLTYDPASSGAWCYLQAAAEFATGRNHQDEQEES